MGWGGRRLGIALGIIALLGLVVWILMPGLIYQLLGIIYTSTTPPNGYSVKGNTIIVTNLGAINMPVRNDTTYVFYWTLTYTPPLLNTTTFPDSDLIVLQFIQNTTLLNTGVTTSFVSGVVSMGMPTPTKEALVPLSNYPMPECMGNWTIVVLPLRIIHQPDWKYYDFFLMIYHDNELVYEGYGVYKFDLSLSLIPSSIAAVETPQMMLYLVPPPPETVNNCWAFNEGAPPGIPVRLPNGTEINGPSLVNTTYDWIAFSNAWEGGKVVFQLYEPGTAMYDWAMSQWVDFKQSAAYEEFVAWAIRQYNAGELFNEVTSADIGTPPTNTTQVVVTLSFYNWTNPYTGWSWELYNVTSPFTGGAMVEETLKAMNITPTPPSQVMINGNNATLVFNNIPFGTTINITLPGGSYEGTSNCWASILRNVAGYYILTGIPNPISIQAYTNLNVDYIVVYAPEYTAGVCTFTP